MNEYATASYVTMQTRRRRRCTPALAPTVVIVAASIFECFFDKECDLNHAFQEGIGQSGLPERTAPSGRHSERSAASRRVSQRKNGKKIAKFT